MVGQLTRAMGSASLANDDLLHGAPPQLTAVATNQRAAVCTRARGRGMAVNTIDIIRLERGLLQLISGLGGVDRSALGLRVNKVTKFGACSRAASRPLCYYTQTLWR